MSGWRRATRSREAGKRCRSPRRWLRGGGVLRGYCEAGWGFCRTRRRSLAMCGCGCLSAATAAAAWAAVTSAPCSDGPYPPRGACAAYVHAFHLIPSPPAHPTPLSSWCDQEELHEEVIDMAKRLGAAGMQLLVIDTGAAMLACLPACRLISCLKGTAFLARPCCALARRAAQPTAAGAAPCCPLPQRVDSCRLGWPRRLRGRGWGATISCPSSSTQGRPSPRCRPAPWQMPSYSLLGSF